MGVPSASVRWVTDRVNPNGRMADSLLSGESNKAGWKYVMKKLNHSRSVQK
jgi:hypothetical protein